MVERGLWVLLACLLYACVAPALVAAEADDEAVRETLRDQGPVWYDAGADDWRRVRAKVREEESGERSSKRIGDGASVDASPLFVFLYVVLIVALVALVAWVVWMALGMRQSRSELDTSEARQRIQTQVAELPFEADGELDPYAERDRALAAGDWMRWMIWHYACQLLWLDRHGLIHLQRWKTNRMYLRELGARRDWSPVLEQSVTWFERVYFGGQQIGRDIVERLRAADERVRHADA